MLLEARQSSKSSLSEYILTQGASSALERTFRLKSSVFVNTVVERDSGSAELAVVLRLRIAALLGLNERAELLLDIQKSIAVV